MKGLRGCLQSWALTHNAVCAENAGHSGTSFFSFDLKNFIHFIISFRIWNLPQTRRCAGEGVQSVFQPKSANRRDFGGVGQAGPCTSGVRRSTCCRHVRACSVLQPWAASRAAATAARPLAEAERSGLAWGERQLHGGK